MEGASNGVDNARAERVDRSVDVVVCDVEMRYCAQPSRSKRAERDAGVGGARDAVAVWIGYGNEVRLDLGNVDPEPFGESASARVIVGETVDVMVERVQRGSGEDSGLP
jgi:hypothetical protein